MIGKGGWQSPPTEAQLRAILARLLPEAANARLDIQARQVEVPSRHRHGLAFAGDYVIKFAWSASAAGLVLEQASILNALAGLSLPVPVPLAVNTDPALLVYRRLPGKALSWSAKAASDDAIIQTIGAQIGELLARLHSPSTLQRLEAAGIALPPPLPQSTPDALRTRMFPLLDRRRANRARILVDQVEEALHSPCARTFLHGDFHGHNLLISDDGLRLLGALDFEESALGDPCYDLRYLPALAPTLDLLTAVMASYERTGSRRLEQHRVLAWHVLTDLGDALWRTEQGVMVVDGPIARRLDDLLVRLDHAGW